LIWSTAYLSSSTRKSTSARIVSDVGSEVANAFGIRFALPDDLVEVYKGSKNDLPAFKNDPSWVLPVRARYVIGRDDIVAYSEVDPDYTQRPDPSELLPVLDRLKASKAALAGQTAIRGESEPGFTLLFDPCLHADATWLSQWEQTVA
jgi:hypothetical protein